MHSANTVCSGLRLPVIVSCCALVISSFLIIDTFNASLHLSLVYIGRTRRDISTAHATCVSLSQHVYVYRGNFMYANRRVSDTTDRLAAHLRCTPLRDSCLSACQARDQIHCAAEQTCVILIRFALVHDQQRLILQHKRAPHRETLLSRVT